MSIPIQIPPMGESIVEATIGQIFTQDGAIVKADAELLELETDKVNQTLYAPQAGKVTLKVKTGDTVKIGQTIGSVEPSKEPVKKEVEPQPKPQSKPQAEPQPQPKQATPPPQKEPAEANLRVTKEAFIAQLQEPKREEPKREREQPAEGGRQETRRPMSKIRKVIGSRLMEAQQSTATLTTFNEVDLEQLMALREKHREAFTKKYGNKLGLMPFFVKAAVSALKEFPDVNSYIDGDEIVHREYFDIGIAVGTEKGTIVPVLRGCDKMSFPDIEAAIADFAKRAREGRLVADELQGAGFTITNGGVYGSLLSTPILTPPQCGILGMHKIEKRAVVVDDKIVIRPMMYLALSYDHRLIDGKESVTFLVHIKNMLEDPARLLLEV